MRPLRLSMTAFGPYAGTETVDFEALGRIGLFVVAGNNGSGKTTIFDALHYSLYGRLPGRRADYSNIRSDHAGDDVECRVSLDFRAHGADWRVERCPTQTRPKRRGTGTVQTQAAATLYRLEGAQPIAVTNRIDEVRAKCAELVGLSSRQFERVALLPQGEFSRVLRESATDRRELLRTLFSSDVFGAATTLLIEESAAVGAADRAEVDRLEHQLRAVANEVGELIGVEAGGSETELIALLENFRNHELAELDAQARRLALQAAEAERGHQIAIATQDRVERRERVRRDLAEHERGQPQHEQDLARLQRARAAIPVANPARSHAQADKRLDETSMQVDGLQHRVNVLLGAVGLAPLDDVNLRTSVTASLDALSSRLTARREIDQQVLRFDEVTVRLAGDLRRAVNELASLIDQRSVTEARRRQAAAELERLELSPGVDQCQLLLQRCTNELAQRRELADLDAERRLIGARAAAITDELPRLEQTHTDATQAMAALPELQRCEATTIAALQDVVRRQAAAELFATSSARLVQLRATYARARSDADAVWNAFIAGSAARLAETLVAGEPCAVCGSHDHPAPAAAQPGETQVGDGEVTAARERAEQALAEVRRLETRIEALHAQDADIVRLNLGELQQSALDAKATALAARSAVEQAQQSAIAHRDLTIRLATARSSHQEHTAQVHIIDQHRSRLLGALGRLADTDVATLVARAETARQACVDAAHSVERRAELGFELDALTQRIDAIGLGQLGAESRRASLADQLENAKFALHQARHERGEHDDQLRALIDDPTDLATINFDERARAVRRAQDSLGELATAVARRGEALQNARRARSLLQDRLQQSEFSSEHEALAAFIESDLVVQLEAHTTRYVTTRDRLLGQLSELEDLPATSPDVAALAESCAAAAAAFAATNHRVITGTHRCDRLERDLRSISAARGERHNADLAHRRLERVAALVKGENDRNTSLENWVLAAHLRDVVELANLRLARTTHQRFQLCVLDDGETRRGKWGLDLGVQDTVTGTRRPTAGLSGGELFQASLALALGLADAVMSQTAGVRIDALFIDEGFGSLDDASVERAIDLLDELRDRGAMVGVITHVPALLEALPRGLTVISNPTGPGSVIRQAA